jgi:hypothetical protein
MADRTCEKCGLVCARPSDLRKHRERKTPCAPIVDARSDTEGRSECRYCGRTFASVQSMNRHIRKNCKIAGTEEGMEMLFEHTLKKQMEEQLAAAEAEVEALRRQLASKSSDAPMAQQGGIAQTVKQGIGTSVGGNVNQINYGPTYNITTFTESPLKLTREQIIAALRGCPGFSQYATMGDSERFHKDNRTIVHDSIMDLTKLSHEDPLSRNVYLSPNRADQAMILASKDVDSKKWEILPLSDALKQMIGGLSKELRKVGHDHSIKIDIDDRGAICGLGFITQVEETRLAQELKRPMVAHLENQRHLVLDGEEPDKDPILE